MFPSRCDMTRAIASYFSKNGFNWPPFFLKACWTPSTCAKKMENVTHSLWKTHHGKPGLFHHCKFRTALTCINLASLGRKR